jgi:hypothetical protein
MRRQLRKEYAMDTLVTILTLLTAAFAGANLVFTMVALQWRDYRWAGFSALGVLFGLMGFAIALH